MSRLLDSTKLKFIKGEDEAAGNGNQTGTTGTPAVIGEEHVDYTCPTLKDVSVRAGRLGRSSGDADAGGGGAGDVDGDGDVDVDGGPVAHVNTAAARPAATDPPKHDHRSHHDHLADMRSEMDTMSIGSASELAVDDLELHPSTFHSALAKRERVAKLLGEVDREAGEVRGRMEKLERVVKKYNDLAVGCMEGPSLDQSLECLRKAEGLLDGSGGADGYVEREGKNDDEIDRLRCITYNNLGCLYRRMSEPEKALQYLQKALAIEQSSSSTQVNELASTHLNLSASYSVLHKDVEALRHGERAIVLLQGRLWPGMSFKDGMEGLLGKMPAGERSPEILRDAHVLSMAYHNVGTQNERLGRIREAQVGIDLDRHAAARPDALTRATRFARSLAGQLQPGVLDRHADFRTRRPHDRHVADEQQDVPAKEWGREHESKGIGDAAVEERGRSEQRQSSRKRQGGGESPLAGEEQGQRQGKIRRVEHCLSDLNDLPTY